MCGHLEILSVRSANLPAGEGVAFLSRNVANYNIGIEVVDISADYLSVNLVGYGVAVDSEGALDGNIMCGHLEILSVRSANLPAGEGIAFLSRNGSDCNIGIEDVGFSVTVILAVNLVGYVVLVDAELSIETNVLCRHGELAVSINSYDIRDIRPAGKGIAFLFRMSGSYGYVSAEGVGIDVAKLRFGTLIILIEVGHLEIVRNPLCIQMQAGHQEMFRTDFILGALSIPAAEGVAVRNGKHIIENGIFLAGGSVFNGGRFNRAGDSAIVRVISYSNRNTGYVAVNVVAIFLALILDGVPNNMNLADIEIALGGLEKVLDLVRRMLGSTGIGAAAPVACGKETEVCRLPQIVIAIAIGVEYAVLCVVRVVSVICCLFAGFGNKTTRVTAKVVLVLYTAVRLAARQVEFFALAFAAPRGAARRQKYEILSLGQFRLRFGFRSRGVGSPLRVQSQVFVRHGFAFPLVLETCIGVPAAEIVVSHCNFRRVNRRTRINLACGGVLVLSARDSAAVQFVIQLHRLNVRLDINLDGSFIALCLGKVKTESVLAVFVFDRVAESGRLEFYMVDGVIGVIANLTDTNRRNLKGLVVPECPATSGLIGTVFVTAP